jgi:manganese/zinc/iron transport system permease protein
MSLLEHLTSFNALLVLIGTAVLGCACGVVGAFTVLRERALIGDCVAHASLPGIAMAFLTFHNRSFLMLFLGAIVAGLVSAWCISIICSYTRIKSDSAIAIVLSCSFGLGLTLSRMIQNAPGGSAAGLDTFIFGKAAMISTSDVVTIACVAVVTIVSTVLLHKEFTLLCFDRHFATTQGYPVKLLDIALMTLVCLCTAAGLPAVGAVMVVALLVFPAATARLWTNSLSRLLMLSGAFGVASCVGGVVASAAVPESITPTGLPTGPLIVLCAALLFGISFLVAPRMSALECRASNRYHKEEDQPHG